MFRILSIISMLKKNPFQYLVQYFVQGLLIIGPIAVTIYIIYTLLNFIDNLIDVNIPGLGLIIVLSGITLLGLIASNILARPVFSIMETIIERIPLVSIIYSSLKDFITAFVGEKKKFNQPVLVKLNRESELHKFGFITQKELSEFGINDMVAVYVPHSYNFSGDLFIVPSTNIEIIEASGTDVMKFIVSGGVAKK